MKDEMGDIMQQKNALEELRSQLSACQREREEYKGAWEATLADHRAEVNASIIWQQRAESLAQQLQQMKERITQLEAQCDRHWIAGAQFGWNCGVVGSNQELQEAIEARRKEISAAKGE